jgi:hypothetical protein
MKWVDNKLFPASGKTAVRNAANLFPSSVLPFSMHAKTVEGSNKLS